MSTTLIQNKSSLIIKVKTMLSSMGFVRDEDGVLHFFIGMDVGNKCLQIEISEKDFDAIQNAAKES